MHQVAERNARRFLALADRLFGDRLVGFYVVGSAALDAFLPDRSDLDFVAVLRNPVEADCRRARLAQLLSGARTGVPAFVRGRPAGPGTCNGVYVAEDQLQRPVTRITPIASHHGITFERGRAFDVNPVVWKTFAEHGVALRGPDARDLGLDPEPQLLRQWNLDNLNGYWTSCATAALNGRPPLKPWMPARWATSWTVLGPVRLHHTIATGEIISKQQAGQYALDVFGAEWRPIVEEALAYWSGGPAHPAFPDARSRHRRSGEFALHVIDAANALPDARQADADPVAELLAARTDRSERAGESGGDTAATVRGINHLTLATSDVERSVRFYTDVLGCQILARWPKGAYLLAGDLWLAVVHGADETRQLDDYSHIAFDASPRDLDQIRARAETSGVEAWQDNWTEGDSIYLLDPSGRRIEVHSTNLLDRLRHATERPWDGLVIAPDAIASVRARQASLE